jgi:hypothetical protein
MLFRFLRAKQKTNAFSLSKGKISTLFSRELKLEYPHNTRDLYLMSNDYQFLPLKLSRNSSI